MDPDELRKAVGGVASGAMVEGAADESLANLRVVAE